MASPENPRPTGGNESLWRKSNAFKIGIGIAVIGSPLSLPVAVIGLSVVAGSAAWHHEKNPLKGGK